MERTDHSQGFLDQRGSQILDALPCFGKGNKPSRTILIGIESAHSIRFNETHDVCPAIDALNIHIPHERHSQTPSRL